MTSLPGKCNKVEHNTVGECYQIRIHSLGRMETHNHLLMWIPQVVLTELQQFKLIGSLQNFLKVTAIMVIFSRTSEQLIVTGCINAAMYKNKRKEGPALCRIFCSLTGTEKQIEAERSISKSIMLWVTGIGLWVWFWSMKHHRSYGSTEQLKKVSTFCHHYLFMINAQSVQR